MPPLKRGTRKPAPFRGLMLRRGIDAAGAFGHGEPP
jgi:hypothetical protein